MTYEDRLWAAAAICFFAAVCFAIAWWGMR